MVAFWKLDPGSSQLYIAITVTLIIGFAFFFAMTKLPTNMRKYVVGIFTFVSGLVFVLEYFWPKPVGVTGTDFNTVQPRNTLESIGFFLGQAISPVGMVINVVAGFLLGLGIYSLLRVHLGRIRRRAKDYQFSILLVVSLVTMFIVGILDWYAKSFATQPGALDFQEDWWIITYVNDGLFNGLYQQMDAAMFSMIAFFILSAAFRAFRVRSIEATVMMVSALILMLNLMGIVTSTWQSGVDSLVNSTGNTFFLNLSLNEIANWLRSNMQIPAIRAIEFGVGLGALAMGLRIWLGLEKGGVS